MLVCVYMSSIVKNVQVVSSELCMRLFDLVQARMCRYGCVCVFVESMMTCVSVFSQFFKNHPVIIMAERKRVCFSTILVGMITY